MHERQLMNQSPRSVLSTLPFLLLLATACGPTSTTPLVDDPVSDEGPQLRSIRLMEKGQTTVQGGSLQAGAPIYIQEHFPEIQGLSDADVFFLDENQLVQNANGYEHIRMEQFHEGIRVWGGDIVIHSKDEQYIGFVGNVGQNLAEIDSVAVVDSSTALQLAREDYAKHNKLGQRPIHC